MYRIPFAEGIIIADVRFVSYDPDRFDIFDLDWEVGGAWEYGITIPKSVFFNLMIDTPVSEVWQLGKRCYIHEYIFAYLCEFEQPSSPTDYF